MQSRCRCCANFSICALCVLAAHVLLLMPADALATPLQIIFSSTPVTSTENTGVSGRIDISFIETVDGDFMQLVLHNTGAGAEAGRLTAVGLEIPPLSAQPVFATGGQGAYFDTLDYDVSVSPGSLNPADGGYDLMITSDGNFQGGSPQGAPEGGQSETLLLFLGDTSAGPGDFLALFSDFYATAPDPIAIGRFQAIGPSGLSDMVITPEPAAVLLMTVLACVPLRRRGAALT